MDTAVAILIPAVGGLAWVAYNHPDEYKRLALILVGVLFAMEIALLAYTTGFTNGLAAGSKATRENTDWPQAAGQDFQLIVILLLIATFVFLVLPHLGIVRRSESPKDE